MKAKKGQTTLSSLVKNKDVKLAIFKIKADICSFKIFRNSKLLFQQFVTLGDLSFQKKSFWSTIGTGWCI